MELTVDQKYELITRNLQEKIVDEEIMKKILAARPLKIYWGTAPTSLCHLGYFAPMFKIIDFLQAGCEVTILIADLHAVLDNMKSTFEQVDARTKVYTVLIQELLKSLNVDISRLKFVKGTDYQLSKEYTLDMYKAHTLISVSEAKHAGAEVVKQSDNPKMTGLLYPTLQALDEQYLGSDAELGGIDQRKIFVHARAIMPALGYKKRFHLMNRMVPGLRFEKTTPLQSVQNEQKESLKEKVLSLVNSEADEKVLADRLQSLLENNDQSNIQLEKMSSSNADSKISLLDTRNQIRSKINKAYCLPGDVDDNCLLTMLDKIVFPVLKLKGLDFVINRKEEHGGKLVYTNIDDVTNDFKTEKLHPADLKLGMVDSLDLMMEPLRNAFKSKESVQLLNKAYPQK
ncbi:tyrosyl-tRNA synthetase [Fadolivirus algeromassiliense]|jgi:tyrosyl-tRNA synthetase|uniref:tyrosine--tRNA ligase n=1 Tax=Fadolivirus FV1/VV64 TaxID=3070911 RepID=A0A7D3V5J3_9VIRU|nr:tyrosyl-tRNA synthetase [Fadolivirus algeromassiliense]QKF93972.1 tyrosyl-tRNA synthetase [Fadolivirus FV1/VV64]